MTTVVIERPRLPSTQQMRTAGRLPVCGEQPCFLAGNIVEKPHSPDGSLHPNRWAKLSWFPEDTAVSHDVYFDARFEGVNTGAEDLVQGDQTVTSSIIMSCALTAGFCNVKGGGNFIQISQLRNCVSKASSFTMPGTSCVRQPAILLFSFFWRLLKFWQYPELLAYVTTEPSRLHQDLGQIGRFLLCMLAAASWIVL